MPRQPLPIPIPLLVLLLGSLNAFGPLAIDMYLPAFPSIAGTFDVPVNHVQRTLATYFIGFAIGQIVYGPATDRFGRKGPLLFGMTLFGVASAGCAMAGSIPMLMAFRFLQAIGGCSQLVISRAIVRDYFEPRDATRVFSFLMLVMGVAPIVAPLLGGWVVAHLSWRWIFWILAVAAIACVMAITLILPESLPKDRRQSHNIARTASIFAELLRDRAFAVYTLAVSLGAAAMFTYVASASFIYIELFHVPPERFGLYFGFNAIGYIGAAQLNAFLAHRVDPRITLRVALSVAAASAIVLLSFILAGQVEFFTILAPLFLFLCSTGFVFPSAVALAMAPHGQHAGNASALLGFIQFLFSTLAGLLVSVLHNDTPLPMAGLICTFAIGSLLINLLFARITAPPTPPAEVPTDAEEAEASATSVSSV